MTGGERGVGGYSVRDVYVLVMKRCAQRGTVSRNDEFGDVDEEACRGDGCYERNEVRSECLRIAPCEEGDDEHSNDDRVSEPGDRVEEAGYGFV